MELREIFVVSTSFNELNVFLPSEGYLHSWTHTNRRVHTACDRDDRLALVSLGLGCELHVDIFEK